MDINFVATINFGEAAYTYVRDGCVIYYGERP